MLQVPIKEVSEAVDTQPIASIASRETSIVQAVGVASPSVVAITTEGGDTKPFSWMGSGTASSEGAPGWLSIQKVPY